MDHLLTEARNPGSTNLDELTPLELVRLMNGEDGHVIPAVGNQAERIAQGITLIAERLRAGGRLIYAGAGTSGRLGVLDATECPPTFNSPPGQVVGLIAGGPSALTQAVEGAEDRPELAVTDLEAIQFKAGDILVGIATSGRTPYVLGAIAHARRLGATTIGLSCNPDSELESAVDLAITVLVGPEVLSGSTRLKAGTATKLVLNMLSTGAMVQLGKVFGNLMVDLRATNTKLRARAQRIVRQLTDLSSEEADALLIRCGGELKTALVARLGNFSPEESRARLQAAGGRIREVILLPSTKKPVPNHSDLCLGIDGGGSHTVALLARLGPGEARSILGRGEAGPSNPQSVGLIHAQGSIDQAIDQAFKRAGLPRGSVGTACLGLSGVGRPQDRLAIQTWAQQRSLAGRIEVTSDVALLLPAGTPQGWGVALVAGTGSIALGRTADGRTARAGGWGYLFGDEGSGYSLAIAGLRAVATAADGRGPATALTVSLVERLNVADSSALIPAIYGNSLDRAALARLAPVILETAETDGVAAKLVQEAAEALAHLAATVVAKLQFDRELVPLALAGGLLLEGAGYRQMVLTALARRSVQVGPVALVTQPAEGALCLAAQLRPRS